MDAPGTRVNLKVWRDHAMHDFSVKLAKAEPQSLQQAMGSQNEHGKLGFMLRPLSPQERSAQGVDHGLLVEGVSGPAASAGLQPGDIVLGINGQPARSVQQVQSEVNDHPKSVALLIERDGRKIFVPLHLG